jgi:hypothetical protein
MKDNSLGNLKAAEGPTKRQAMLIRKVDTMRKALLGKFLGSLKI